MSTTIVDGKDAHRILAASFAKILRLTKAGGVPYSAEHSSFVFDGPAQLAVMAEPTVERSVSLSLSAQVPAEQEPPLLDRGEALAIAVLSGDQSAAASALADFLLEQELDWVQAAAAPLREEGARGERARVLDTLAELRAEAHDSLAYYDSMSDWGRAHMEFVDGRLAEIEEVVRRAQSVRQYRESVIRERLSLTALTDEERESMLAFEMAGATRFLRGQS